MIAKQEASALLAPISPLPLEPIRLGNTKRLLSKAGWSETIFTKKDNGQSESNWKGPLRADGKTVGEGSIQLSTYGENGSLYAIMLHHDLHETGFANELRDLLRNTSEFFIERERIEQQKRYLFSVGQSDGKFSGELPVGAM